MMEVITCTGCDRPILDKYLLNVSNQSWHADCVTCSECKNKLTDKCFTRDGKLFCRDDFFKKFGTKCAGCQQGILPSDLVRRARSKVFHLNCFKCIACRKLLSTGEELYILDENRFICKEDFLSSRHHAVTAGAASPPEPDLDDSSTVVSPPDSEANIKFEDDDHDDDLLSGSSSSHLGLNSLPPGQVHPHTHSGLPPFASSGGSGSLMGLSSKSSPMSASSSLSDSGHALTDSLCAGSPNGTLGSVGGTNSNANTSLTNGSAATAPGTSGAGNDENTPGTKRRGPRTTIKAKQLETLKQAFSETPKPTRHIREQLASQTGLNMRVIQVWFQNRRSKERRMKQVNAMGNHRRPFFGRTPRRAMRPLRTGGLGIGSHDGLDDSPEMVGGPNNAYGYFSESSNPGEFGFGAPPPGNPAHPHPPAHPGGPPGPYYDFFGPGSTGPYPGEPHPMATPDGSTGPNAPPNSASAAANDTTMNGIESASGWPMSQI